MSSKFPVVRQINWLAFVLHMFVIVLSTWWFGVFGIVIYLVLFLLMRQMIAGKFRKGMRLLKNENFDNAIICFQDSYVFFNKHMLLNKYIGIIISVSKITYKEMSLLNIAYCHIMKKDGAKAKETYEQTLYEFPNSTIAKNALNTFEAMKNID